VIRAVTPLRQHALNEACDLFGEALRAHGHRLYWQAFRILGNREDAEDALQDGLLSAVRHFDQFEGRSKLTTWLTRVVVNAALMMRRGKQAYRETSLENLLWCEVDSPVEIADGRQPGPEQICASSEIRALISEQFDLLSPTLRSAFQLYQLDDQSCEEARQNLGITVHAMKSRVTRAKRQMASRLNHVRSEPGKSRLKKRREP
jgi:RNA polymerase sigma-70 factor, ECF subfamily